MPFCWSWGVAGGWVGNGKSEERFRILVLVEGGGVVCLKRGIFMGEYDTFGHTSLVVAALL